MASLQKVADAERAASTVDRSALRQLLASVETADLVDALAARRYVCLPPLPGDVSPPAGLVFGWRSIRWQGRIYLLSPREIEVVAAFAAAHPRPLTYADLTARIWPHEAGVTSARTYVHYVRRKVPGLLSEKGRWRQGSVQYFALNLAASALGAAS